MIGQLKSVLLIGSSEKILIGSDLIFKNWSDSQSLVLIRIYLSDGRIGDDHKVFLLVKWWFHHDEQIIVYQIIYRIVYQNVDQISFLSSKFFLGHFLREFLDDYQLIGQKMWLSLWLASSNWSAIWLASFRNTISVSLLKFINWFTILSLI